MKKRRKAEVSGVQQEIITLRDVERFSWGKIDAQLKLSKGSSATLYRRGKRALAAREAAQRDWERNESHRFSESAWWRLSKSDRKRYADRAPFPPEIMATLSKPKRSRDDRAWNRADNPLLTGEEKTETQTPSEPLPQPTIAPTPSQRAPEPTQPAAPARVPALESKARLVLDWNERSTYDGSPIYRDRDGKPIEVVSGTGPRANRLFLAGSNETVELAIARVFRRGEMWLLRDTRDGAEREVEMENPHSYESETDYEKRRVFAFDRKKPRVSWLKILKIGQLIDTSRLADDRALRNDALAEQSRLQRQAREQAVSRSEFIKEVDAQRQEQRRAEKSEPALTDAELEKIYFKEFR